MKVNIDSLQIKIGDGKDVVWVDTKPFILVGNRYLPYISEQEIKDYIRRELDTESYPILAHMALYFGMEDVVKEWEDKNV